jgi:hypothetical protein
MYKVLVVGLDSLASSVVKKIQSKFDVYGFDFNVDRIIDFNLNNLILNNQNEALEKLLKKTDILIINTDKYDSLLKYLIFLPDDSIAIDTSGYKGNIANLRKNLKNKSTSFIPCNFSLFPDVIINTDKYSSIIALKKIHAFFENATIKTMDLNCEENDKIFADIYQIPILLQEFFLKKNVCFFKRENIDWEHVLSDIISNKKNVVDGLMDLSKFLEGGNIENTILFATKSNKNVLDTKMESDIFIKIILECFLINSFPKYNKYFELIKIKFTHKLYDSVSVSEYIRENDVSYNIFIMIEKIKSLIRILDFSFLQKDNFKNYLTNI